MNISQDKEIRQLISKIKVNPNSEVLTSNIDIDI